MGVLPIQRTAQPGFGRSATSLPFSKLVQELVAFVGKKLAYIAGVKDVRALDRWIDGTAAYKSAEERLRIALRVIKTLENHDHASVVQACLTGAEPGIEWPRSDLNVTRKRSRDSRPADSRR